MDYTINYKGIKLEKYKYKLLVLPLNNMVSWAGLGVINCGNESCFSWYNMYFRSSLYLHELGHNFGIKHATTPNSEYGDETCVMGSGSPQQKCYNSPHRYLLGWDKPNKEIISSNDKKINTTVILANESDFITVNDTLFIEVFMKEVYVYLLNEDTSTVKLCRLSETHTPCNLTMFNIIIYLEHKTSDTYVVRIFQNSEYSIINIPPTPSSPIASPSQSPIVQSPEILRSPPGIIIDKPNFIIYNPNITTVSKSNNIISYNIKLIYILLLVVYMIV
jgi:hypothetical protein